ncbi:hypothetical protein A3B87_01285 [Candidatus Kuenenbacteria bacterium RIFCSPHIGHO2_02_FULL_39_13]|uniref:Uncharacterized protein n=1 Tax=Candidatus Kuenenbacteria bacterium RIFCSPHIGHO2_02_FULL_39_13 TaxID=1798561 RepID=A0A1F6FM04_9BACT|nr:MAG: hypothetical protein A3B87_01285 [Candidatus Kuenenbacteria bacterium RIFCSPHIGHO2_02_FULL_39_13]
MNNNNQPVTKKELDEILDHKLHQWTKKEIVPTVESMFDKFGEKIDKKFEEINKNIKTSENRIVNSNDKLAGEIKKAHEEMMATVMSSKQANEKYQQYDKTLKNYGERLKILEGQSV